MLAMPKPMSMPFGRSGRTQHSAKLLMAIPRRRAWSRIGVLGHVGRQHGRQVEAGVVLGAGPEQAGVDRVGDELPDDVVAGPVDAPHPAQMPVEMPLLDEPQQRELAERRRLHAEQLPPRDRRIDQRIGQRHEAQPERG